MKLAAEEVQMSNAALLTAAGITAIQSGDTHFDFSRVARCDSSAVAMLLAWQRVASVGTAVLSFEALPESLTQLVDLYGLQDIALPGMPIAAAMPVHSAHA